MENMPKFVSACVFLISLAFISYEIILVRVSAIIHWQNLSSLIISLALLGFGTSGTFLAIFFEKIKRAYAKNFFVLLLLFPLTLAGGFVIYCKIPLNAFEIGIDPRQIIYFILSFTVITFPFFFCAGIIGLALQRYPINKIYFFNLAGSGAGAVLIIFLSRFFHPFDILTIILAIAAIAVMFFSLNFRKKIFWFVVGLSFIFVTIFYLSFDLLKLKKLSEYKPLSRTLLLPGSKIIAERYSPLGLVQAIKADGLRYSEDLSLLSTSQVPEQMALFFDGDSMSPVLPFNGKLAQFSYIDYTPSALAYALLPADNNKSMLVIGAGGGFAILKGLYGNFKHIHALEINPDIISLMNNELKDYSGNIYGNPKVTVFEKDHRAHLTNLKDHYSLIDISLNDSFSGSSSGVYALNENYLYTVDSFLLLFNALRENGILCITRWNTTPPREDIKIINLAVNTLKNSGVTDPARHLFIIRSMRTLVVLLSKSAFTEKQIQQGRIFAQKRAFDLVYHYNILPAETNKFIRLPYPIYYQATVSFLSNSPAEFEDSYPFDITLSTDNRPYFYNFFKWKSLPYFVGEKSLPFTEWGSFILILFFIPTLILSFILIVMPLLFSNIRPNKITLLTFLYFSLIGIGFFFVEMPLIQKFILFLHHPVYSISVTISGLLIFSGIGSFFSDRVFDKKNRIFKASLCLILILILYQMKLSTIFSVFSDYSFVSKVIITMFLFFPLGFFMGFFFPQGLSAVKNYDEKTLPWAWSINGFFSVISVMSANILSLWMGFHIVLYTALVCYLFAGILSLKLTKK